MKTIIISIIGLVIGFLFVARAEITFFPFSIKFESLISALGWLCIAIGLIFGMTLINIDCYRKGKKEGMKHCIELIEEISENK